MFDDVQTNLLSVINTLIAVIGTGLTARIIFLSLTWGTAMMRRAIKNRSKTAL